MLRKRTTWLLLPSALVRRQVDELAVGAAGVERPGVVAAAVVVHSADGRGQGHRLAVNVVERAARGRRLALVDLHVAGVHADVGLLPPVFDGTTTSSESIPSSPWKKM